MKYYGALEAGGTKMVCAIGTENGEILEKVRIPTEEPRVCMQNILNFFQGKDLAALGVGCFGLLNLDRKDASFGSITTTPKLQWRNYPIYQQLRDALGIPVGIDTDVNAAAIGESAWGCTRDVETSIYVTVGTGIGVGVILNGAPFHGMIHPEAGHIAVCRRGDDPMVRGVCPYHANCAEGFASGPAIAQRWGRPAEELLDCAAVWEMEAYYIGQIICSYIYTYSPERIVLGGGVGEQELLLPLIRTEVKRQLGGYVQGKGLDHLESYIVHSELNGQQGVLGCIKLAMDAEQEEKHEG